MKTSLIALLLAAIGCFACTSISAQEAEISTDEAAEVDGDTDSKAATEEATEEDHSSGDTHASDDHADGDHSDGAHAAGDHGDGEHVDTDPTHANVSDKTWGVVDFRTDMAFFSAIVFLALLLGLAAVAWKPIMEGLEKRETTIANNIANAEKLSKDAEARLAEYEAKLSAANEEAATILSDARKDAEAAGQKLIASAQEEAVSQRERAVADIESAKRVALGEIANQSADVAMSLAGRVVGREVKAEDHQSLIQDMLAKLPSNN